MTNVTTHKTIDEAGAEAVLDAAERHARAHGHRVVIAVVERSGELVALRRTPGAQIASSRVAVDKAQDRRDLRPPQPRARAAGLERTARRACACTAPGR